MTPGWAIVIMFAALFCGSALILSLEGGPGPKIWAGMTDGPSRAPAESWPERYARMEREVQAQMPPGCTYRYIVHDGLLNMTLIRCPEGIAAFR